MIWMHENYNIFKKKFISNRVWRIDNKYEPFVYIIQNTKNQKFYIGSRTAKNCLENNLGHSYFTSSNQINKFWKNDPNLYNILKIYKCASSHDALILETILLKESNAIHNNCFINKVNFIMGFETGSGENNPFYGKSHSQETKEKISKANKGKYSGAKNPHYNLKGKLSPHYNKPKSKEQKMKMSLARRKANSIQVSCLNCKKTGEHQAMKTHHFENCGREKHNTGFKHSNAKRINIYDAFGSLIDSSFGGFNKLCIEKGYPFKPLSSSYKNDGKPIMLSNLSRKKAYRENNSRFIGWYALIVENYSSSMIGEEQKGQNDGAPSSS